LWISLYGSVKRRHAGENRIPENSWLFEKNDSGLRNEGKCLSGHFTRSTLFFSEKIQVATFFPSSNLTILLAQDISPMLD
jgi:hypothetical protein